jgi:hypothetical protein
MFSGIENRSPMLFYFKLGLLLYWACWFSLACTTNLFDFLHAMGYLPAQWLFRSGNYTLLAGVINIYHMPSLILNLLFICDISVQGLSALLFFIAFFSFWMRAARPWRFINTAFALSIALWAVFLIMEEVFIAYRFEGTHSGLIVFETISLMALHLLP